MFRVVNALAPSSQNSLQQSARSFATLKDISIRLKSIKNIQKITKSMKMVSAAKYAKAERDLKGARAYGEGAQLFVGNIAAPADDQTALKVAEGGESGGPAAKRLLILMSSDRGLCGSVHTSIAKAAKNILANKPPGLDYKIVCIGDKSRMLMQRLYNNEFLFTVSEYGRVPPSFKDASAAASAILSSGYDFDGGEILFNRFKTVVSFETKRLQLLSLDAIKNNEKVKMYDSVDDFVLKSYVEYSLAQSIYYAMKESATSEQASRMTAMDGASKNAGEMIDKLTLQFNRTRQAVITRELIEIISGAAAV